MTATLLSILCLAAVGYVKPEISFEDGTETIIENPARGLASGGWVEFKPEGLPKWRGQGGFHSSLWELSRFSGGREEKGKRPNPERVGGKDIPISEAMKADARRFLDETREKGGTLIVRLGYTWSEQAGCEPADFDVLLGHVRDLSRILAPYDDVVVAVEAGAAGPWGEMHTSDYCKPEYMNRILRTYLDNLGPRIPVLVRAPGYFCKFAGTDTAGLLAQLPFKDKYLKRLGMYNDGYLGTWWDYGTWAGDFTRERGCQLLKSCDRIPYGGEMAYVDKDWIAENRERCRDLFDPEKWNIVRDWYDTQLTYLRNISEGGHTLAEFLRNELVFDSKKWAYEGMPDIHEYDGQNMNKFVADHMGYRFVIRDARLPSELAVGRPARLAVDVENTGFGRLLLPTKAEVLVVKDGQVEVFPAKFDPNLRGGERRRLAVDFTLPASTRTRGECALYLRLSALLKDEPADATPRRPIRFANESMWDVKTLANRLGSTRVILL